MAGRITANVFFFTVSVVTAGETAPTFNRRPADSYVTFGRLSSFGDMKSSTPDLLDTSQWLTRELAVIPPIQINGVEIPLEDERKPSPSSRITALLASVRTRRMPLLKRQVEEEENIDVEVEMTEHVDPTILKAVSKPFVPKAIWDRLRGVEFDEPSVVEDLVASGLSMTASDGGTASDNEWITWKAHAKNEPASNTDVDNVRVHVGRCSKSDADDYYGANLPMIRTEAIIENMKPSEMAELLLDSSRVKIYNKMSIGRTDLREISCDKGIAKIVRNLTQPPVTSKKIESTTFMHARRLNDEGTYLVVSRAVCLPNNDTTNGSSDDKENGKSEILLGVNLLEPYDGDRSLKMTSVTHVYAPSLPAMIAARVGVNSAISFVKDIRSTCEEPAKATAN